MIQNKAILVFPFIILSLISAIWTGWIRIGWSFPVTNLAAQHGALMVNGFVASLIFLERAVTFQKREVLLWPLINALSVIVFIAGLPRIAQAIFIAGSGGFVVMCFYVVYRFKPSYYLIYLVVTALLWPAHFYGNILLSLAMALTAIWLLKFDMAKHSIKAKGQHRYSGLLLLAGYAWLLIMSALLVVQDRLAFGNDAVLHSFFIGFAFSMIFSHAVILLPAITGLIVKIYHPILYVWFVLLQVSLVVRIVGDLMEDPLCRKIGGMANGLSILLFFVSAVVIMKSELRKNQRMRTTLAKGKTIMPAWG